jgi:hypothetical protein
MYNMLARTICVFAVIASTLGLPRLICANSVMAAPVCPAPARMQLPAAVSLVVAVSRAGAASAQESATAQLCLLTHSGSFTPLYHQLPTGDIAISADGSALAYRDTTYRMHIVRLPGGADRGLGRGVAPQFSFDGRYLAFVSSATLPKPASAERLVVYDLATGALAGAGPLTLPRTGDWPRLFSWSPRAESLVWSPDPGRLGTVEIRSVDRVVAPRIVIVAKSGVSSPVVWSADGRGLLFWHQVGTVSPVAIKPLRFSLAWWPTSGQSTETLIASVPVRFVEGALPAPVSDATGTMFASMLGAPGGNLNQVSLYARDKTPRAVPLPGEPREVLFAPTGSQFITLWSPPYGQGVASHAALVDANTGKTQQLGTAIGAYWIRATAGSQP